MRDQENVNVMTSKNLMKEVLDERNKNLGLKLIAGRPNMEKVCRFFIICFCFLVVEIFAFVLMFSDVSEDKGREHGSSGRFLLWV